MNVTAVKGPGETHRKHGRFRGAGPGYR
jgi:hypothetical protein